MFAAVCSWGRANECGGRSTGSRRYLVLDNLFSWCFEPLKRAGRDRDALVDAGRPLVIACKWGDIRCCRLVVTERVVVVREEKRPGQEM